MLPEYFALIGSIVASLGVYYYALRTFRGQVQPNRLTWLLWTLFPLITFWALLTSGAGIAAWVAFFGVIPSALVLVLSYCNKKAYWRIRHHDYALAALAALGLFLWHVTGDALYGVIFSILADFAVSLIIVFKSWSAPLSESAVAYLVNLIGFCVVALAISTWTVSSAVYVLYLIGINALFVGVLLLRRVTIK